jgi:hypothetical protein
MDGSYFVLGGFEKSNRNMQVATVMEQIPLTPIINSPLQPTLYILSSKSTLRFLDIPPMP